MAQQSQISSAAQYLFYDVRAGTVLSDAGKHGKIILPWSNANRSEARDEMSETVTIKGSCQGYKRGATFEMTNGRIWEQTCSTYSYSYSYRPDAELDASGSRGQLKVEGMDDWVDVKKIK
jgi:hypothetical protein